MIGGGANGCVLAVPLRLGRNGPFSSQIATTTLPAWSCGAGAHGNWFRYDVSYPSDVTFSTCSSATDSDTVIEVFSGSCLRLTSVGCNDDACGDGSSVTASLNAGRTYYVRVGGVRGARGNTDVVVQVGTGGGSVSTVRTGCGATTIATSGLPNLTATITVALGNVVGTPALSLGLTPANVLLCPPSSCAFGHDWLDVVLADRLQLTVPCNAALIGARAFVQGVDIGARNGCRFPLLFTLTDTVVLRIG